MEFWEEQEHIFTAFAGYGGVLLFFTADIPLN